MTPNQLFPDVELTTPRLRLRPLQASDVDAVHAACSDPVTQHWLPLPRPYTRDDATGFCLELAPHIRDSGRGLVRAVESSDGLVGVIDLKRTDWAAKVTEIGYWTAPRARGTGVMTAATTALSRWVLKDLGFARVELRIAADNLASMRVAEKAGFSREGVARSAGYVHSGRVDLVIWSLLPSDLA